MNTSEIYYNMFRDRDEVEISPILLCFFHNFKKTVSLYQLGNVTSEGLDTQTLKIFPGSPHHNVISTFVKISTSRPVGARYADDTWTVCVCLELVEQLTFYNDLFKRKYYWINWNNKKPSIMNLRVLSPDYCAILLNVNRWVLCVC